MHIFVCESCSDLFNSQFAWWFAFGLTVFAQLTVGDVVRCDVGITQHCSALSKGKSAFELFARFGLPALDAGLLSYGHRVLLLRLGELLPFRAGFGRNVHQIRWLCPYECRPVSHIIPELEHGCA